MPLNSLKMGRIANTYYWIFSPYKYTHSDSSPPFLQTIGAVRMSLWNHCSLLFLKEGIFYLHYYENESAVRQKQHNMHPTQKQPKGFLNNSTALSCVWVILFFLKKETNTSLLNIDPNLMRRRYFPKQIELVKQQAANRSTQIYPTYTRAFKPLIFTQPSCNSKLV